MQVEKYEVYLDKYYMMFNTMTFDVVMPYEVDLILLIRTLVCVVKDI